MNDPGGATGGARGVGMIVGAILIAVLIAGASVLLVHYYSAGEAEMEDARPAEQATKQQHTYESSDIGKTPGLNPTQQRMIHAEKMASLGRLAAAVAHELNNPLSGIVMYARLVERELGESGFSPEKREELGRYLRQVQTDGRRCGDIVSNLLLFARPSAGAFERHHLNHILTRSLTLICHHLEMAHVQLETHPLDGDDVIACDADHLQQAFVALVVNAAEGLASGDRVIVRTAALNGSVGVEISSISRSAGPEMHASPVAPNGSANGNASRAGLALAGVELIVQRHGGTIDIEPIAENGTTVRIVLPRNPSGTGA